MTKALRSRLSKWSRPQKPLTLLFYLALFLAGLWYYCRDLAPGALEGDPALFQYTPAVLGVTYPTGYPSYLLLGKLWVSLIPWGDWAWRMNFLSAFLAALSLPFLYSAMRRILGDGFGASLGTAAFATLPTFTRWATEAKIYPFNIFLFSLLLWLLSRLSNSPGTAEGGWRLGRRLIRWDTLALLVLGLEMTVHSTTVLFIPGVLLWFWLNHRNTILGQGWWKKAIALLAPLSLYLLVPLRAEMLLAAYKPLPGLAMPVAVARGLVSGFYHSGWQGWLRYFFAADFTGGVVRNWGLVPEQFKAVYWPLLMEEFGYAGLAVILSGAIWLAWRKPGWFLPTALIPLLLIPFVLTYGQGEQSAFLLPVDAIFCLWAGAVVPLLRTPLRKWDSRYQGHASQTVGLACLLLAIPYLNGHVQENHTWLKNKWDNSQYRYWEYVLDHPLGQGAALTGQWGDLTTFWYLQNAEGKRPDLLGIYPPDESRVGPWVQAGHELYVAGPLQGWAEGIETRYQLIPWGKLLRLAPPKTQGKAVLPTLPTPLDVLYDQNFRLTGCRFPAQVESGGSLPVSFTWENKAEFSIKAKISLQLVDESGAIIAQLDDRIISGWYPLENVPAGNAGLVYYPLALPEGTLPGRYKLQVVAYRHASQPWQWQPGQVAYPLGEVTVAFTQPFRQPHLDELKEVDGDLTFGNAIRLSGQRIGVDRVRQGRGFSVTLLWQALQRPAADYQLKVDLIDKSGKIWKSFSRMPLEGKAPPSGWQPGQLVRDTFSILLPADAPPGTDTLQIRLSWLDGSGQLLPAWRWHLPVGNQFTLGSVDVVEQEGRVFTLPPMQQTSGANFENKMKLAGFDEPRLTCPNSEDCNLNLTLYWEGVSLMDTSYQVFIHLVGEDGKIFAQDDRIPTSNKNDRPTSSWAPEEIISDRHELKLPARPAGRFRLIVGVYLPPEGPRLKLLDHPAGSETDSLEITSVNY
jgi:hypothetical protein